MVSALAKYSGDFNFGLNEVLEPLSFEQVFKAQESDQLELNSRIRIYPNIIKEFGFINHFTHLVEENLILHRILKERCETVTNVSLIIFN